MWYTLSLLLLVVLPCLWSHSIGAQAKPIATTWYPAWHGQDFPPENIPWTGYDEVKYAFAVTTPDPSVISLSSQDLQLLPHFVSVAHQNNVKASLAIGGWTGSRYFSSAVATAANRTQFVAAITELVTQYQLDGIDFDWEYPNQPGIGCNTISPDDTANFLSFLLLLRASPIGSKIIVSAAVSVTPFPGPSGSPLTDVSGFAKALNYIEIMNYDIWGSWSAGGVGPNAPLDDSCNGVQAGSAVSAIKAWTTAKFPASKIVLGVAAYGHSYFVNKSDAIKQKGLASYPPFDPSKQPNGDSWDSPAGVDQCGNATPIGGVFNFWGLVQGGFLSQQGTTAPGILRRFDSCSQTPYVYNPKTQVMVSFDDAQSFAAKGHLITQSGLKGFAMWHVAGDFNDILLNSIRGAIGI